MSRIVPSIRSFYNMNCFSFHKSIFKFESCCYNVKMINIGLWILYLYSSILFKCLYQSTTVLLNISISCLFKYTCVIEMNTYVKQYGWDLISVSFTSWPFYSLPSYSLWKRICNSFEIIWKYKSNNPSVLYHCKYYHKTFGAIKFRFCLLKPEY